MRGNSWESTTVGALLKRDGGSIKTGPFGTTLKAREYSNVGVPLISVGEIGYGSLCVHKSTPRVPQEVIARLPAYVLEAGDIVFGRKGAVDRSALVKAEQNGWFLGSDGIRLRLPKTCDARFVAYHFQNPSTRSWLIQHSTGSTMASLNQGTIERVPILLPRLSEQLAIAQTLGALDDKIDLNRRTSETLEAMARAIFKDWFVDFGPTRTKMEGSAPYLSSDIWALFADRLDDSGKPEGWKVGQLDDLLLLQRGFDLPNPQRIPGEYPVVAASGINGTHNEFMVRGPGVTTGRSGVLGKVFFIHDDFWPLNTSLWVKEFKISSPTHAYFLLQTLDFGAFNAGSAVPTLNRNHVHNLPQPIPDRRLVEAFDSIVIPLFRRQRANELESNVLVETRDLLLPRLMSGEIRLRDAEKLVEEMT